MKIPTGIAIHARIGNKQTATIATNMNRQPRSPAISLKRRHNKMQSKIHISIVYYI